MATNLISLDGMVFGMPPGTHVSDAVMKASMPTASIIPCEPEFSKGLSLFTLNNGKGAKKYKDILEEVGYTITSDRIEVAYLADNFPTDTFTNEYGETFLDKFAQAASSGLGDLAQIAGWTSFDVASKQVGDMATTLGLGGAKKVVGEYADKMDSRAQNMNEKNRNMYSSMKNAMKGIVTGARVDFPQVWKNSSYTPSYSMTIRLYNPNPASEEMTKKYIVGPIAALVALGIPNVSEDSSMYKWPLLCKVFSPGIYSLPAAYINSISVIKGGDQQSIAYNQNLAMCDVRIDFGSLYNSILAGPGSGKHGFKRPTLSSYLNSIGGSDGVLSHRRRRRVSSKSKGPDKPSEEYKDTFMKKNNSTADPTTPSDTPKARTTANQKITETALEWRGR